MQAFSQEDLQSLLDAFMTSDSDFAEPLFNDETNQFLLSQAKVEASQVDQVGSAEIDPYAVEVYEQYQRTKEDQLTLDAIIEREKLREKIEAMEGTKGITTLNQIVQEYQNAKTNVIEIFRKRSQQVEERLLKLSESMVEVLQKKIAEIVSAQHVKAIPHQEIEALLSLMEVEEIRKCSFFKELDKFQYLFLRVYIWVQFRRFNLQGPSCTVLCVRYRRTPKETFPYKNKPSPVLTPREVRKTW